MKCTNDVLMNKIGVNKLSKSVEATLEVLSNLPDCRKINTKKYIDIIPATVEGEDTPTPNPSYNGYEVPENRFECMRQGCINSGTMYPGVKGETIFRVQYDAVEFAAGVITFYVKDAESPLTVKISDTKNFTNADVFTVTVDERSKGVDGFIPVVLDLASTSPSSVEGEGWTATRNGAFLSIGDGESIGISSIAIFDSIFDFATSHVVKVGCLTELGTDFELDAAEATCWSSGYDTSEEPQFERSITGNSVTSNYWLLNPLMAKGSATQAGVSTTIKQTVQADGDYGTVVLADIYQDDCGFLDAQLADNCNVFDSQLERLTIPTMVDVDEGHFFAIPNDDGTTTLYFNKALVGKEVNVTYMQLADVEEQIGDFDNVGDARVRYTETVTYTDGTKEVFVFNNVLVTSFPFTINEDETEFSFTITIQKDVDGHYFHKYTVRN